MKINQPIYKLSFEELKQLFKRKSGEDLVLEPYVGKGVLQVFDLERGLQARVWDCYFNKEIDLVNNAETETGAAYFTLAFFPCTQGLCFSGGDTFLPENQVWDTLFTTSTCHYKIHLNSQSRGHCLSISFSRKWLDKNILENNEAFRSLKEKIDTTEPFLLPECMTLSEKKLIQELLEHSWEKSLGSFYIKSAVLKIISDFFYKIKDRETFNISNHLNSSISEVEKYLVQNVTGALPNLKELAGKFCISESTLKRHFKKNYGVNISTYFIYKKMEYARQLMQEQKKSLAEAAGLLGYRNINHFATTFKRYQEL